MKKVESTVVLENVTCRYSDVLGCCPRQELVYWQEAWLRRANQKFKRSASGTSREDV